MYGYGYGAQNVIASSSNGSSLTFAILIISIAAAIVIYVLFLDKEKSKSYSNGIRRLYDFLQFDTFLLEKILKIAYIFLAIHLTLSSIATIGSNVILALIMLAFGNIILRVIFEFLMVTYKICTNVSEINKKLK